MCVCRLKYAWLRLEPAVRTRYYGVCFIRLVTTDISSDLSYSPCLVRLECRWWRMRCKKIKQKYINESVFIFFFKYVLMFISANFEFFCTPVFLIFPFFFNLIYFLLSVHLICHILLYFYVFVIYLFVCLFTIFFFLLRVLVGKLRAKGRTHPPLVFLVLSIDRVLSVA